MKTRPGRSCIIMPSSAIPAASPPADPALDRAAMHESHDSSPDHDNGAGGLVTGSAIAASRNSRPVPLPNRHPPTGCRADESHVTNRTSSCGSKRSAVARSSQMSMSKPVGLKMATATPSARQGPSRRRSRTPGCSSWTRSHPPPAPALPEGAEGPCLGVASSHSGHLHGIERRTGNLEGS